MPGCANTCKIANEVTDCLFERKYRNTPNFCETYFCECRGRFHKESKVLILILSSNFVRPNLSFGSQKNLSQKSVLKLRQVATCLKSAGEDLNMAARIRINFAAREYFRRRGPDGIIADRQIMILCIT
jgi:hypothetical protein